MRGINFTTPMLRKVAYTPVGYNQFPPARGCKTQTRRKVSNRPYKVGEVLYVKEAWVETGHVVEYWADVEGDAFVRQELKAGRFRKFPGRYMGQRQARYFIKITAAREQNLLDIDHLDAFAEGFDTVEAYLAYFRQINPKAGENPRVIVYSFVRVDAPKD